MLQLPDGFLHGDILQARRVGGLILAKARYAPGARIARHAHPHARFDFVVSGSFTEVYDGRTRQARAGLLIVRPAGETHSEHVHAAGTTCLTVDLSAEWLARAREEGADLHGSAELRGGLIGLLCHRLVHEFHERDEVARLAIEGLVAGIAAEASRRLVAGPAGRPWLEHARELLHARYADHLTLDAIADAVGVHPVHLARAFRVAYRCTIGDYVRQLRLEFACRQVTVSDAPLCEIALAAGFCDQSHFSRVFKRYTGLTPASYRVAFRQPR